MKIFKDILMQKIGTRLYFSKGRVYLFVSVLLFIITLSYMLVKNETGGDVNVQTFQSIIDALEWAIGLFALYVLGGKTVGSISEAIANKAMAKVDDKKKEGEDGPAI